VVDNCNGGSGGDGDRGGQWWWMLIADRVMVNIIHIRIPLSDIKTPSEVLMIKIYFRPMKCLDS